MKVGYMAGVGRATSGGSTTTTSSSGSPILSNPKEYSDDRTESRNTDAPTSTRDDVVVLKDGNKSDDGLPSWLKTTMLLVALAILVKKFKK